MTAFAFGIVLASAPAGQAAPPPQLADGRPTRSSGRITATPNCPKAPDGFTVELVMEQPDVRWPSAVHGREDGSLLVAEDPMDMPGPSDQPLDRIWLLRFAPDGSFTKTLFADHLFAVMGMQEIDDAVYVMNMPHLTILRDRDGDGVAEERHELIENLGPPAPGWPGGFNDHIVSGLRLGMDGFLYVSVGDKGIPLATTQQGGRLTLRGGGVVRVWPDGSQLELVASGTRNHLDVAIDERDCLFTYDNTDDGLGWWTRFTHIMPTGYYGYPWDYHDHPERMLPCMKDDGGGSPVGGLIYREDAWPAEFRGDLFYCEWADRVIRRFKVERDGASFKCTLTEDFVTPGASGEFRPLDIAESADGRYLYVADWNHPGWTSPELAGRVWRIRRSDDVAGAPPIGGLPDVTMATVGKASLDDLVANLGHPAFRRRLAAQRELSRRARGADAAMLQSRFSALVTEVNRKGGADLATERTLRHLLWALFGAEQRPATAVMADALKSPCADLRAQATRALGQKCDNEVALVKILTDLVWHDPDLMVRREAAIAMGRSRDPRLFWPLMKALEGNEDLFVRFAIRQSMRALPRDYERLLARVMPTLAPRVGEDVWLALRETYDVKFVTALSTFVADTAVPAELRARALGILSELHRKRPAWDGKWWSIQPAKSGWPARTEAWEGTDAVIAALRKAFDSIDDPVRAAALESVRTTKEAALFPCVRARFEAAADDGERVALLALLAEVRDADSVPIFTRMLAAPAPALRVAAIGALDRVQGDAALPALEPALRDADVGVRVAALEVFARHPDEKRLADYLGGLTIGGATAERCRSAIASLRAQVKPALEAMAMRGDVEPAALAIVREIYDDPLPLAHWKLLGPMPRATHLDAIERAGDLAAFPPAGDLAAGSVPAAKDGLPAKCVETDGAPPHGFVDLNAKLRMTSEVVAYAYATLDSPIARTARCAIGSDDGVTVWVNGAQVHANPGDRGWSPDQDRFEVPLRAGPNTLLLRVEQAGGDWSFNVKVSEVPKGPLYSAPGADRGATEPGSPAFEREAWRAYALAHAGDAARGKTLFFAEKGVGCFRCHAIAGVGPKLGPDLRDVGTKYSRAELVTSILEPSQKIQEGYTSTNVFLKNDDVLSGLVVSEKDGVLSLADANGVVREIPLADVKEKRASKLSAMPADVVERLTQQELADLVAWLETLKQ